MEQRMPLVEPHLHFRLGGRNREVRRTNAAQFTGAFAWTFVERLAKTRVTCEVSFFGSFGDRLTLLSRGGRNEQATNTGEDKERTRAGHDVLRSSDDSAP